MPLIEAEFGKWATPPAPAKGVKNSLPRRRARPPRIVLVDRPGSPQSVISGGQLTPTDPTDIIEALLAANDALGGDFLGRLNMDLREAKGWSYGVRGSAQLNKKAVPYIINAPVQADRTGDSIKELEPSDRPLPRFEGSDRRGTEPDHLQAGRCAPRSI